MREFFRQQLMAVIQRKQKEASACLDKEQMNLMFEIGREVGFSTIGIAYVEGSLVLLNQHDPFDDLFIKVIITEEDSHLYKVRVLLDSNPLDTVQLIQEYSEDYSSLLNEIICSADKEYQSWAE